MSNYKSLLGSAFSALEAKQVTEANRSQKYYDDLNLIINKCNDQIIEAASKGECAVRCDFRTLEIDEDAFKDCIQRLTNRGFFTDRFLDTLFVSWSE